MPIDLRSDTVTKPTPAMRDAMARAEVGDDMNGEDPTVNRLEAMMAERLGKEAAVYGCSGTMSNQMGVRAHCVSGDELLIDQTGHIANFEAGAPAALSGVTCRTVAGHRGMLDVPLLEGKVRADNQHLCVTRLVCVENTTNLGGGACYPLDQLNRVCEWAHRLGLKVHMDGARLFNAVVATGHSAAEICRNVDTVSICFSKGLGCPMGSVLVGSKEQVYRARRARKQFGGALRQAGIVAASAVYAMEHHVERLREDHDNAKAFTAALGGIKGISLEYPDVQTNIVFFRVDPSLGNAAQLAYKLKQRGILIGALGPQLLRACTHLDVARDDALQAAKAIGECLAEGLAGSPGSATGPYARG